jgi:hypothetical protein
MEKILCRLPLHSRLKTVSRPTVGTYLKRANRGRDEREKRKQAVLSHTEVPSILLFLPTIPVWLFVGNNDRFRSVVTSTLLICFKANTTSGSVLGGQANFETLKNSGKTAHQS